MIGGGWNREIPGQAKISHTGVFFHCKFCFLQLKDTFTKEVKNLQFTCKVVSATADLAKFLARSQLITTGLRRLMIKWKTTGLASLHFPMLSKVSI